jgi:hypothetical protein
MLIPAFYHENPKDRVSLSSTENPLSTLFGSRTTPHSLSVQPTIYTVNGKECLSFCVTVGNDSMCVDFPIEKAVIFAEQIIEIARLQKNGGSHDNA